MSSFVQARKELARQAGRKARVRREGWGALLHLLGTVLLHPYLVMLALGILSRYHEVVPALGYWETVLVVMGWRALVFRYNWTRGQLDNNRRKVWAEKADNLA